MKQWDHVVSGVRPLLGAFEAGKDSSAENLHAIHAVLSRHRCFRDFDGLEDMHEFQDSVDKDEDLDTANALLCEMWDYADEKRIWIK